MTNTTTTQITDTDMRDIGQGTLRRIDWQELLPVLFLLRAVRLALGLRPLFFASFGVMLMAIFGVFVNSLSVAPTLWNTETEVVEVAELPQPVADVEPLFRPMTPSPLTKTPESFAKRARLIDELRRSVLIPWETFTTSFVQIFTGPFNVLDRILAVVWFVWLLCVWTLFGGAISRTAALRLTGDHQEGAKSLATYLNVRWPSYIGAVLLPIAAIFACAIPIGIARLLFSVPFVNILVAAGFPVVLFFAFCIAILAIGLCFGVLMFAAVSTDGSDAFDAVSRAYSYVYQRPLHLVMYLLFSGVIGYISWLLFSLLVDTTLFFTLYFGGFAEAGRLVSTSSLFNGLGFGFGILSEPQVRDVTLQTAPTVSGAMLQLWISCFHFTKVGFIFSYFWTSGTAMYLILRKSVDDVQTDVVKL